MAKGIRISLAAKCQLLFGLAVVLILTTALLVVWVRLENLVADTPEAAARALANAWLEDRIDLGRALSAGGDPDLVARAESGLTMTVYLRDELDQAIERDAFLGRAIERFQTYDDELDAFVAARDEEGARYYRYLRAVRQSDLDKDPLLGRSITGFRPGIGSPALADPLEMALLIELRAPEVEQQFLINRIYLVAAFAVAGLLAILVFWLITTRLILSPVRVLREAAEKASEGDLNLRADVSTGDEFEHLAGAFNQMLTNLKQQQDQLFKANKSLDLKLGELAEHNVALYEANKIKGEFLANVSHELRTPLNSIVGFAELLQERTGDASEDPAAAKQHRYLENIIISSRALLNLINDLLDLAKIEAGRMELRIEEVSLSDLAEGMINLIRPQAEKQGVHLEARVEPDTPLIQTDSGKLQQIVFNFLSNAVKFTPEGGRIDLLVTTDRAAATDQPIAVRIEVRDTGPGIALEDQRRIFEKFTRLDTTVTREHGGTGLGLTISRELASLLHGRIELESDAGRGAAFTLVLPLAAPSAVNPLMPASPPTGTQPALNPTAAS